MTQLIPVQVDDNTIIYIEPTSEITIPTTPAPPPATNRELTRGDLDLGDKGAIEEATRLAGEGFAVMQTTIKTYTQRTLDAFKELGSANVDKVQLEFGINLGGEAGVPYVTKGTAECSLKITVECSFPKSSDQPDASA